MAIREAKIRPRVTIPNSLHLLDSPQRSALRDCMHGVIDTC